jgi:hypothetical protein
LELRMQHDPPFVPDGGSSLDRPSMRNPAAVKAAGVISPWRFVERETPFPAPSLSDSSRPSSSDAFLESRSANGKTRGQNGLREFGPGRQLPSAAVRLMLIERGWSLP